MYIHNYVEYNFFKYNAEYNRIRIKGTKLIIVRTIYVYLSCDARILWKEETSGGEWKYTNRGDGYH